MYGRKGSAGRGPAKGSRSGWSGQGNGGVVGKRRQSRSKARKVRRGAGSRGRGGGGFGGGGGNLRIGHRM